MGTPVFAAAPLERLYNDGHDIAGVFTQPDKSRNRGMRVSYSPVKEIAMAHGTAVFQPEKLSDGTAADIISGLNCDMIVVVAYGKLLPRDILDLPPLGCINIHASLLPKYRGAAPIQWAILNGEKETGLTSIYLSEELDAGDMILSKRTLVGDDETARELFERLSLSGAELLSETIGAILSGKAARIPQIQSEATYAPPLRKEMSPIDWKDKALQIKRKVRGLDPWPVATAEFGGTIYKVFSVDISDRRQEGKNPGDVISAGRQGIEVACADAAIIIKELQAPGGRRMQASEYLKGHKID